MGGVFGARQRTTEKRDYHEEFIFGQTAIHNVLRRSAERIVELTAGEPKEDVLAVARYSELFRQFLDIHHRQEDEQIFPTLRKHLGENFMGSEEKDHVDVAALLASLHEATQAEEQNLKSIHTVMVKLAGMLPDHLTREEAAMTDEVYRQHFSEQETRALSKAIHDMIEPTMNRGVSLVFLIHHLTDEEKVFFDERLPWFLQYFLFPHFASKEDVEVWKLMPHGRFGLRGNPSFTACSGS